MSFMLGTFLQSFQKNVFNFLNKFKNVFYKLLVFLLTTSVIVWLSVFLYGTFYYTYMPAVSHVKPVHLQFKSCDNDKKCSFPTAQVALTKKGYDQLLIRGQQYKVYLDIEMPESPVNQNLGMFMVEISFLSRSGEVVRTSARTAMLHYKSPLLQSISTIVFAPLLLSGSAEEKQLISVELCDYYEEDPNKPAVGVRIEIQSNQVEIYSSQLRIYAHFTGLRYLMFHWPLISAVIGIGTNLFFLSIVALLSWYRYLVAHEKQAVVVRVGFEDNKLRDMELRRFQMKEFLKREKKRQSMHASLSSLDISTPVQTAKELRFEPMSVHRTKSLETISPPTKQSLDSPLRRRAMTSSLSHHLATQLASEPLGTKKPKKSSPLAYEESWHKQLDGESNPKKGDDIKQDSDHSSNTTSEPEQDFDFDAVILQDDDRQAGDGASEQGGITLNLSPTSGTSEDGSSGLRCRHMVEKISIDK